MSWAAHQFEVYLVHAHLPRRMRGGVSFWAVAAGDFIPDFLSKFWVYGFTIGERHYGASVPHQWHRGWPGMGITHTVIFGLVVAAFVWLSHSVPTVAARRPVPWQKTGSRRDTGQWPEARRGE